MYIENQKRLPCELFLYRDGKKQLIDKKSRISWKYQVQNYRFHLVTISTFLDKLYYLVRQVIDRNSFTDEWLLSSINLVRQASAFPLEDFVSTSFMVWFGFKGTSLCSKQVELILVLIPIASKKKLNYMLYIVPDESIKPNRTQVQVKWTKPPPNLGEA